MRPDWRPVSFHGVSTHDVLQCLVFTQTSKSSISIPRANTGRVSTPSCRSGAWNGPSKTWADLLLAVDYDSNI